MVHKFDVRFSKFHKHLFDFLFQLSISILVTSELLEARQFPTASTDTSRGSHENLTTMY